MYWSERHAKAADLQTQRGTSCSWLELACAVDIMTGGAVGPPGSSFTCKTEVIKHGVIEILRTLRMRRPERAGDMSSVPMKGKQFIGILSDIKTVGPCGFSRPAGLDRRPLFECHKNRTLAADTLIC